MMIDGTEGLVIQNKIKPDKLRDVAYIIRFHSIWDLGGIPFDASQLCLPRSAEWEEVEKVLGNLPDIQGDEYTLQELAEATLQVVGNKIAGYLGDYCRWLKCVDNDDLVLRLIVPDDLDWGKRWRTYTACIGQDVKGWIQAYDYIERQ